MPPENTAAPAAGAAGGWACDRCTFLNNKDLPYCEACGCPQSQPAEAQAAADTWRCKRCTFVNPAASLCCDACGNDPATVARTRRGSTAHAQSYRQQQQETLAARSGQAAPEGGGWVRSGVLNDELRQQVATAAKKVQDLSAKGKFADSEFPADAKSLYGPKRRGTSGVDWEWKRPHHLTKSLFSAAGKSIGHRLKGGKKSWEWKRPSDLGGKWVVMGDSIEPADIQQGELGDCWFLSVLGVLAERPHLIDRVLLTKEYNPQGAYAVQFFHNGSWTPVVVDDRFPTKDNRLVYGHCKGNELWVSIIEKAYAKLHGSYSAIMGGQAFHAMYDLTGAPCESIDMQKPEFNADREWLRLLSFQEAKFLMAASCGRRGASAKDAESWGLVYEHAYSVMDIRAVDGHRLLKLLNPWGRMEWRGDWGPDSKLWTPQLRQALDYTEKQPGAFWISYRDFLRHFSSVDVCKEQMSWHTVTLPDQFHDPAGVVPRQMFELHTVASTWMFAMLIQESKRGETSRNEYVDFGLLVHECPGGPQQLAGQRPVAHLWPTMARVCNVEFLAPKAAGRYLLLPFSTAPQSQAMEYKFAIYSANPVFVRPVPFSPTTFRSHLLDAIHHNSTPEEVHPRISTHTGYFGVAHCVMVVNAHPEDSLVLETDASDSHNITCSRKRMALKDTVPPNSRQLVAIFTHAVGKTDSKWVSRSSLLKLNPAQLRSMRPPAHEPPLAGDADLHADVPLAGATPASSA